MKDLAEFDGLLRKSLLAVAIGALLVAVCYLFVDRPVSYFVNDHRSPYDYLLRDVTYPPPILQWWVPVVLAALAVRRAWGPFRRWEQTLLAASVSLVLADQFKETFAFVFGRYWPNTWIDNNPSLIQSGAYGFHPFHSGRAYESFPSGHTARTLGAAAVVWVAYPRLRWACVVASTVVAVGLVGMNYHFVGDVVAGAFFGGLVGVYAAHFLGLAPRREA